MVLSACSPAPAPTVAPSEGRASPEITPTPTAVPAPGSELFGFVPYWEMDAGIVGHVARTPLTTLVLFSVTNTNKGAIRTSASGYGQITGDIGRSLIRAGHDHGMSVQLSFSSFGIARNERLFTKPATQAAVVASLVTLVEELGLDGVNVDVESLDPELVPAYGRFVGSLRTALRAGGSTRQVSVATTANLVGATMAAAAVNAGADRVFMMAYDYRTGASEPGSDLAHRET